MGVAPLPGRDAFDALPSAEMNLTVGKPLINSETAHKMFYQLMERFDKIEKMLERQNKMKECRLLKFPEMQNPSPIRML